MVLVQHAHFGFILSDKTTVVIHVVTPKQCRAQYSPVQPDMIDESITSRSSCIRWLLRRQELMKCIRDCTGGWVVWLQLTLISQQAVPLNYSSGVLSHWVLLWKTTNFIQYNMNRYSQCFLYDSSVQSRIDFLLLLIVAGWLRNMILTRWLFQLVLVIALSRQGKAMENNATLSKVRFYSLPSRESTCYKNSLI